MKLIGELLPPITTPSHLLMRLTSFCRLIGKMVADGKNEVPGHEGQEIHPAGTILYKVLWQGFPPEVATWEVEDDIPCGEVDFVGDYETALEEEQDQEEAEDDD